MKVHIEYEVGDQVLYQRVSGCDIVGTITYRAGHFIFGGCVIDGDAIREWNEIKPYKKEIQIINTK